MSLQTILGLIALVLCFAHAVNARVPLWAAVLLLALALVLPALRLR
ncbi:hypothetical protein JRI60_25960 [Archangium violaceum]|nr:hypothetical protein [Archangium violaceum]QRO02215.1 hypothetical protein JRI60_25960 [Archangium violaceum]